MERLLRYDRRPRGRARCSHVSTKDTGAHPRRDRARRRRRVPPRRMNRMLGDHDRPTYLRLLSEMNNGANPYAANDLNGRSRGRAYLHAAPSSARGGAPCWSSAAAMWPPSTRGCARLRMPPVRTDADGARHPAGGVPLGAALLRQSRDRPQPPAPLVARVALRGLGRHHLVLAVPGREGDRPLLPPPPLARASRSPSASTASGAPRARASCSCSSASCAPTRACS